jgi:hypothetical protein
MGAYYTIRSLLSQCMIDIQGRSTEAGAKLNTTLPTAPVVDSQLWEFIADPAGSGYFFIKNKSQGYVIDIQDGSTETGALLVVRKWLFSLKARGSLLTGFYIA